MLRGDSMMHFCTVTQPHVGPLRDRLPQLHASGHVAAAEVKVYSFRW